MPHDHCHRGGEPTNYRIRQNSADSTKRLKHHPLTVAVLQAAVAKRPHRFAEPYQRWSDRHQQKMLSHVSGQHLSIEVCEWRSHRYPRAKQAEEEAAGTPGGNIATESTRVCDPHAPEYQSKNN
jgi:hypothetical protein